MTTVYQKIVKAFAGPSSNEDSILACVNTLVNYYGGQTRRKQLVEIYSDLIVGTSNFRISCLLEKIGFNVKAYEIGVESLSSLSDPFIIQIDNPSRRDHYGVCFSSDNDAFFVVDPSWGICNYESRDLFSILQSPIVLVPKPGKTFVDNKKRTRQKFTILLNILKPDTFPLIFLASIYSLIIISFAATISMGSKLIPGIVLDRKGEIFNILILIGTSSLVPALYFILSFGLSKQCKEINDRLVLSTLGPGSAFSHYSPDNKLFYKDILFNKFTMENLLSSIVRGSLMAICCVIVLLHVFKFTALIVALLVLQNIFLLKLMFSKKSKEQASAVNGFAENIDDLMKAAKTMNRIHVSHLLNGITQSYEQSTRQSLQNQAKNKYRLHGLYWLTISGWIMAFLVFHIVTEAPLSNYEIGGLTAALIGVTIPFLWVRNYVVPFKILSDLFNKYCIIMSGAKVTERDFTFRDKQIDVSEINVKNLVLQYYQSEPLMLNANFQIRKGEFTTLYGASSSGKTSIVSVLQGTLSPNCGQIYVNGQQLNPVQDFEWAKSIYVVTSAAPIIEGSVAYNICLTRTENVKSIVEFCQKYGFETFIQKLPFSYHTNLRENGSNLSTTQRSLILLIRALYARPKIVIIDDATKDMDSETEKHILSILHTIKSQTVVVYCSSRKSIADQSDVVLKIESKTVVVKKSELNRS